MSEFAFYMNVLRALEAVGAHYMVVGAFGASAYGLSRATHDADIIVDLDSAACEALAAHFPPPRYYADPQQMRDSIRLGIMFNIIDGSLGVKADLVPLSREPTYRQAFQQRVRCTVVDAQGEEFEIWCARPEDIILGKLMAWQQGRSAKHPADIAVVLSFVLGGFSADPFDVDYVTAQTTQIGTEALALWLELLGRTQRRVPGEAPRF
ncbi:MAG: nucleotidyl transferase AbiEii/AbiGii toxin family protein [Anaerolinea sp.]|nr:nucleotidyl transferase AbiEii/AbiGii toxin family protein [Anaerolinea sp.]